MQIFYINYTFYIASVKFTSNFLYIFYNLYFFCQVFFQTFFLHNRDIVIIHAKRNNGIKIPFISSHAKTIRGYRSNLAADLKFSFRSIMPAKKGPFE